MVLNARVKVRASNLACLVWLILHHPMKNKFHVFNLVLVTNQYRQNNK